MMLFRSVCDADLDAVYHLAKQSGVGLTTLPKNKKIIGERIAHSIKSHKNAVLVPDNEYYFFVLEDTEKKIIVGTSAIESKTGSKAPFYSYKVSKRTRWCHSLNIRSEYDILSLVNDYQGCSELCTLFLTSDYRKQKNGLLLSKARFLFMIQHTERFAPMIIADLRGVSDNNGYSPFWDNIGSHFFHMSFKEADALTLSTNKQFIADLMPRNPIYVTLLSKEAQAVIGKPHQSTIPAMNILLKEGFRYNNYIDIFDGGPTIMSPLQEIKSCAQSCMMHIKSISDEVSSAPYLLSNTQIGFRAIINYAILNKEDNTCLISKKAAALLEVQCGDSIRVAPL